MMVRKLRVHARDDVKAYAMEHVEQDRETFVSLVMDDLRRLHEGVIARYRLRPSEFEAWRAEIRKELAGR